MSSKYEITVTVNIDTLIEPSIFEELQTDKIASSVTGQIPNISQYFNAEEFKDSPEFSDYETFILDLISDIETEYGFYTVDYHISDVSGLSHYLNGYFIAEDGNKIYTRLIEFRISNHVLPEDTNKHFNHNKKSAEKYKQPKSKPVQKWIFRDIIINEVKFNTYDEAEADIKNRVLKIRNKYSHHDPNAMKFDEFMSEIQDTLPNISELCSQIICYGNTTQQLKTWIGKLSKILIRINARIDITDYDKFDKEYYVYLFGDFKDLSTTKNCLKRYATDLDEETINLVSSNGFKFVQDIKNWICPIMETYNDLSKIETENKISEFYRDNFSE